MVDYSQHFSEDVPSFFRSPVREIFKRVDLSRIYSFAGGYPSADTFPLSQMGALAGKVASKYGSKALQYGGTQGVPELRQVLSDRYGVPLGNIQITTSSQQGIDVCTRILADPGDVILTVCPTYLGALQSFRSYRAEVRAFPLSDSFAADIERAAREVRAEGKKVAFIYLIPDFQNPSGETISLPMRREIVETARKEDLLVVEDSPYRELRYEGEDVPSLYSLAPERVLHLGSFSKIFAPGLRLGWIFGPETLLDAIYVCKQSLDLCPPVFDQYLAAEFMGSGALDANLVHTRSLYRAKRDLMLSLLERLMPEGVSWTRPEGGLFLFLTLPEGFDSVAFYETALSAGVAYVAGSFFGAGANTMRLNFSFMSEDRIREGLALLSDLIRKAL